MALLTLQKPTSQITTLKTISAWLYTEWKDYMGRVEMIIDIMIDLHWQLDNCLTTAYWRVLNFKDVIYGISTPTSYWSISCLVFLGTKS